MEWSRVSLKPSQLVFCPLLFCSSCQNRSSTHCDSIWEIRRVATITSRTSQSTKSNFLTPSPAHRSEIAVLLSSNAYISLNMNLWTLKFGIHAFLTVSFYLKSSCIKHFRWPLSGFHHGNLDSSETRFVPISCWCELRTMIFLTIAKVNLHVSCQHFACHCVALCLWYWNSNNRRRLLFAGFLGHPVDVVIM